LFGQIFDLRFDAFQKQHFAFLAIERVTFVHII
jgi:hypothetical protein